MMRRTSALFTTSFVTCPGRKLASQSLQVQVQSFGTRSTETLLPIRILRSPQTQRCTITLFVNPAASIVKLSSSSVRFGNVVPIVYARVLFSGRELHAGIVITSTKKSVKQDHSRVDETAKIAHSIVQIHPRHKSAETTAQRTPHHQRNARTYLVPSARRTCTLVVGFD
jgi:hypothetical protein